MIAKLQVGGWLPAARQCPHSYQKCSFHCKTGQPTEVAGPVESALLKRSTVRLGDLYPETGAQERERNQKFCHRNCPYCLCVGDGELVFSAGTSVEECARTRGSALLTMVFIGMCFLVFSFVEHRLNSAYL